MTPIYTMYDPYCTKYGSYEGEPLRNGVCVILTLITPHNRLGMRGPENPRTQDAYGLQRADIARVLSVALSYVASNLVATPKDQRKPDSASLRSFAEQRYLARCVAPQDLSLIPCCYSFLIQGKNTRENILRATIWDFCKRGTHSVSILCT